MLVIGRGGQVARALVRRAASRGLALEALGRPMLDLEAPARAAALIRERRPSVVINAAAYTAVDDAEDNRESAFRLNAEAPGVLAEAAEAVGAPLIHFSTDYVFAGDKTGPYVETDATAPTTAYGASKLAGERNVLAANAKAVVLRTAWVFDSAGKNFVRTMLRAAKGNDTLPVVYDQNGCPTYADDLADAALSIAVSPPVPGVFHCVAQDETSWADFASEVFARARARGGPSAMVEPITTAEYRKRNKSRANRPANSRLDCTKLALTYGIRLRPWRDALAACLDKIAAEGWRVE